MLQITRQKDVKYCSLNTTSKLVRQKTRVVARVPCCCWQHAAAVECHNHCQLSTSPHPPSSSGTHPVTRIDKPCHAWCVKKGLATSHGAFETRSMVTLDAQCPPCCQATDRCREQDSTHRADCRDDSCHDHFYYVTSVLHSCNVSQTYTERNQTYITFVLMLQHQTYAEQLCKTQHNQ